MFLFLPVKRLSTQYTLGLLKKFELTFDEYRKISLYCKDRNNKNKSDNNTVNNDSSICE